MSDTWGASGNGRKGNRKNLRAAREQERKLQLRHRWFSGAVAVAVAGALMFSGTAPAAFADEAPPPTDTTTTATDASTPAADETTPAEPAPEEPAAEQPPAEQPATEQPATEEPAAPDATTPDETTPDETTPGDTTSGSTTPGKIAGKTSRTATQDAAITPMALVACAGWPHPSSPVANFEIDGNLCVDTAGRLDWANVPGQPARADLFSDATQFTGGSKESNWPWSASDYAGSGTAPGKTDMGNIYAYTQTVGGHVYAYLGFERQANNGSVSYHVELNQKPNIGGPTPDRSVGDLRLTIEQNGSNIISLVGAHRWNGTAWVSLPNLSAFVGVVNQDTINNLTTAELEDGIFAEAAVDLTVLFGNAGCSGNYGVLNVRSSSSPEETSSLADWINPIALNVPSTCSTLTILKTGPTGTPLAGATFSVSPNPATGTGSVTGLVTDANGKIVFNGNVQPGTYTVTETAAPAGYLLANPVSQQVTFGAQAESKTLTFVDPLGDVTWLKHDRAGALLGGATFVITATGGAAAVAPWDLDSAPITVVDNTGQPGYTGRDTDAAAGKFKVTGLPIGTYSVAETAAPAGYVLDSTPQAFSISQAAPNATISTAFVNTPYATVTLTKVWVDAFTGDTAQISFSGGATKQATSTAPTNGPVIDVSVAPGTSLNLAEILGAGNTGLYTSSLTCVGATPTNNTGLSGSIVVPQWPASANGVQCTFANTTIKKTVTLRKNWVDSIAGDKAALTAGAATATSTANGTPNQLDTQNVAVATVRVGDSVTLSEVLSGQGSYGSTYSCSEGTVSGNGTGVSFSLTVPNANVVCTFDNQARRATVTLKKQWVDAFEGDEANLSITGAESDSATSVAPEGSVVDDEDVASVVVRIGDEVTLGEQLGAENTGVYDTTWSCDDGTSGSGGSIPEFTVEESVTCTITNTTRKTDIVLDKLWIDAFEGDSAELSINDETGTSTATGTSPQLDDSVVTLTVRVGDSVDVAEELGGDNTGVYTSSYSCPAVDLLGEGTDASFTAPDEDVTCTFTNVAVKRTITLQKSWIDAIQGDTAELTAGDDTAVSTASGVSPQLDTQNTATTEVRVGDTVDLSEVVSGDGTYASSYDCSAGETTGNGTGRSFALTVPNADVVCTFENESQRATVTLKKEWVNAFAGDEADLDITGAESDSATSVATEGSSVDEANVASVDVRLGQQVTLSEDLGDENTGSYTATWACDDGTSGSGGTIAEFTVEDDIVCTITNTADTIDITVNKVWVHAFLGDSAELSINDASDTSTAIGLAEQTDSSVVTETVRVGEQVTVAEEFGDNRGSYAAEYECSGAGGEGTGTSTTFTAPSADVECTFTNTAIEVGVLLQKRWLGALPLDQAVLSMAREGQLGVTATSIATGLVPDQLDSGKTIQLQVRLGEILSLAETVSGLGSYASNYLCSGGETTGTGSGRAFQLTVTEDGIACLFVNRALTQVVTVVKTWVNGQEGDTATLAVAGGATGTATSTADGTVGEFTDVQNTINAQAVIGDDVTVSEVVDVLAGSPDDYTSSLVCTADDGTVLLDESDTDGTFAMPDQPVSCEFVNEAELPTITLLKEVEGADVSDTNWQLTATPDEGDPVTNPEGGDVETTEVATGVGFTLSEALITNFPGANEFAAGEWSCTSDISGDIELSDSEPGSATLRSLDKGENVTCEIVNSHVDQGYTIQKDLVSSVDNGDGTWTITYEITVHNNSVVVPITYDLDDTVDDVSGVTLHSGTWTGPTSGSFDFETSNSAQLADDQELAPYEVIGEDTTDDVYTVEIMAEVTAPISEPVPCGEGGDGVGIVNTALLTVGDDTPVPDDACGEIHLDDIGIEKTSSIEEDTVDPNTEFDYVLTVTNHGTQTATGVHVRDDDFHPRLVLHSYAVSAGVVSHEGADHNLANRILDLVIDSLAPGESFTVTIHVTLTQLEPDVVHVDPGEEPSAPDPLESLVNEACVDTAADPIDGPRDGVDDEFAPNCDTFNIPVDDLTGVVYTVCVSDTAALGFFIRTSGSLANSPVSFDWTTKDEPDAEGHSVTIDPFFAGPDGFGTEITWPGARFTNGNVAIDYPGWRPLEASDYGPNGGYINPDDGLEYAPEDAGFFVFNGLILDPSEIDYAWRFGSTVTFTVNPTLTFDVEYPGPEAGCVQARDSNVQIEKSASVERTTPGSAFDYTLAVQNVSDDSAADGVIVTDEIPSDIKITDVSWTGEGDDSVFPNWETCAVSGQNAQGYGGTLTCDLFGPLQPGQSAPTIKLAATVNPSSSASEIDNVAAVVYYTFDNPGDTGRDEDDAVVLLTPLAVTGGTIGTWALWAGLAAVLGGITLLHITRRRKEAVRSAAE